MSDQENAPPVGLVPKWIRDRQRALEIVAAIQRFSEAGQRIPREWVQELRHLDIYKKESGIVDEL